ncbi:hypothetical protein NIES267_49630 [Calothrix parasitica NIES-267]|uniref:Uncharacterized protein n=1 Tax=Calothrix parasitica NIES-267 TaxID=1973488 RepID=A0A1Z4LW68_9CYAN|nr:hypothetical protein NIES267_49630 [Calothrix parasitica NIES-267]
MTPRANQIQEMIADIDKLLQHKGKRLWGVISSTDEPREVLQRVRDFLANEALSGETSQAQLPPLVAKFMQEGHQDLGEPKPQPQTSANNQLYELIEPVKAELKTLLEERANLVTEIRELEKKRLHDYSLAQQLASQEKIISEFMQVLRNRLENDVALPLTASIDGDSNTTTKKALPASIGQGDSTRVENLAKLTSDLDQRLVALDGTVNVVFEALQRNIHAYHDSLSQSLARMHYKGVQGEQLLEVFIKNVANLSPAQVNSELIEQVSDEVNVETIDAQSVESTETGNFNYDSETVETVELTETSNQFNHDFESVESDAVDENIETYGQDNNDNLVVTPDKNIDNIEFSQAQENLDLDNDNIYVSPDFEAAISQIEQDSVNEDDTEELELTEEIEEQFAQNQENEQVSQPVNQQAIEQEIVKEPDAFDTPDKMQAVLTELKKSSSTEQLVAEKSSSSDNANEDEVDELYASLFDSENLTPSSPQAPPKQVITQAIDVENHPTSPELDSQLKEIQIEKEEKEEKEDKEVVSREVVFEYIPPTATDETSESSAFASLDNQSPENQSPILDLSSGESTSQNPQANQTVSKTYKRKQAKSEDTINSLTELLFEEEPKPVKNSQLKSQSKSELQPEEITTPEIQQETAPKPQEITPPEIQQQKTASTPEIQQAKQPEPPTQPTEEKPQLKEITLPVSSLRQRNIPQPKKELDLSTLNTTTINTPLPQTEKTIADSEEISQDNSTGSVNSTEIHPVNPEDTVWYLGLDIGTTGISAALLNRSTTQIHPIYWSQENPATAQSRSFRLPAEVYLPRTSINSDKGENAEQNIYSAYLKPYLPISLAYKSISETASSEIRQKWEPILQLNEFSAVPLVWIIRSLSKLLLTLKSDSNSTTLGLTATAIGIQKEQFSSIINNISGIICTCPSNWSEQYRFNIRESLIISQLVEHPQQVFFVEEAIASLLGELEGANGEIVKLVNDENSAHTVTSDSQLLGNTLVINIGASATEMALVDLPEDKQDLSHNEFMLHGFTCGGKAMEQDIITQLLLPSKWRKQRNPKSNDANSENNPLHWKPNIPGLDQIRFSSLGLEQLELPRAGEPDISQRISLQQRLESSPLGKALLDAAIALKLILQHQESFTIELADQRWELQRRDLESQVFVPFVRRINRELNKLLVARGIPTEAINQIVLCGGVSSISAISRWLQQKLPSAKIIQEKYLSENGTPATSRVATGLCVLALHPLVLEIPRQQYTDYFLFTELLRLLPEKAVTFGEVIQLFESRGINTRTCQQRLLAFLEGEIPPGLVPSNQDMQWLNNSSVQNSNYKSITSSPLFDKQGSLSYRPNLRQLQQLRNYLDAIKNSAHQSLEEPYTVNFAVVVNE